MANTPETCPLCGSPPTDFHDSYSDGAEFIRLPFYRQQCVSNSCGLPCRLWESVKKLVDKSRAYEIKKVFGNG